MSNHPVRLLRRSEKMSCLVAKAPMKRTKRHVKICVPVSIERLGKDKDADENVDFRSNKNGETC